MVLTDACWVLSNAVGKSNFFETKKKKKKVLGIRETCGTYKTSAACYSWRKFMHNSTKQLFTVFLLKYPVTLYEVL